MFIPSFLAIFFPLVHIANAFKIGAGLPSQATVGQTAVFTWTRESGDPTHIVLAKTAGDDPRTAVITSLEDEKATSGSATATILFHHKEPLTIIGYDPRQPAQQPFFTHSLFIEVLTGSGPAQTPITTTTRSSPPVASTPTSSSSSQDPNSLPDPKSSTISSPIPSPTEPSPVPSTEPTRDVEENSKRSHTPIIIGATIGSFVALFLLLSLAFLYCLRRRDRHRMDATIPDIEFFRERMVKVDDTTVIGSRSRPETLVDPGQQIPEIRIKRATGSTEQILTHASFYGLSKGYDDDAGSEVSTVSTSTLDSVAEERSDL